tara:strand:- start:10031 stop:10282 length:252 start_codon:yes stop_codon:yes gene_type:complete
MAFKMKGFSGFKSSAMKNEDMGALRPLKEGEGKTKAGTAPGAIGTIFESIKNLGKAHNKLHKDYKTIGKATKAINPYDMGSMK